MPVDIDSNNDVLRATRKLRRSGNSVVLSFPPEHLKEAGLSLGDEVEVIVELGSDGDLTIRRATEENDPTTETITSD